MIGLGRAKMRSLFLILKKHPEIVRRKGSRELLRRGSLSGEQLY